MGAGVVVVGVVVVVVVDLGVVVVVGFGVVVVVEDDVVGLGATGGFVVVLVVDVVGLAVLTEAENKTTTVSIGKMKFIFVQIFGN